MRALDVVNSTERNFLEASIQPLVLHPASALRLLRNSSWNSVIISDYF